LAFFDCLLCTEINITFTYFNKQKFRLMISLTIGWTASMSSRCHKHFALYDSN